MRRSRLRLGGAAAMAAAAVVSTAAAGAAASNSPSSVTRVSPAAAKAVHVELAPSSAQLARCMPHADVDVRVDLTTDAVGFDVFTVDAEGLPASTDFTVFLL